MEKVSPDFIAVARVTIRARPMIGQKSERGSPRPASAWSVSPEKEEIHHQWLIKQIV